MADVLDDTELRKSIAEIVKNGDLATLTSRQIREILEKKYDVNLMNRKKQIDDIVMQIIDEESDDSDDNASAESPSKSDTGKKSSKEESSEEETETQTRVSAKVVNKKAKKKSKEESDSNEQESDDDDDESYEDPPKLRKKQTVKRPAAKNMEKSKDAKKPKTEKGGAKKKTGFAKPMLLSPKLAALMGETHMARSDIVKKMWQIIKERNLLDPSNKRYTICDDELKEIFGHKRFMTFAMMKFLKKHIKDPALM